jgi:hypothetical protein
VERRVTLFDASEFGLSPFQHSFSVAADGTFLFLRSREASGEAPSLVWVDHWFSELEARLQH